jgi:hypothetical protein
MPTQPSVATPGARRLIPALALIAGIPMLWVMLAAALATDRGLDLTDEGLYLLESDPPSPTSVWGTPYGWVTAPLFRAVEQSIAGARTAAAVLLVLASLLLAHQTLTLAASLAPRAAPSTGADRATTLLLTFALGTSGLLFYTYVGLLRTPSYNWVNLLGILVTTSGVVMACRPSERAHGPRSSRHGLLLSAVLIATGSFLAIHAKPTTPLILAAASLPILGRRLGSDGRRRLIVLSAVVGSGLVVAAALTSFWPDQFWDVFIRIVRAPPISEGHGLGRAVVLLATAPLELMRRAILMQPHWLVGPLLVAGLVPLTAALPGRLRLGQGALGASLLLPGAILIIVPDAVIAFVHSGALGPFSDLLMPGRLEWPPEGYMEDFRSLVRITGWLLVAPLGALAWLRASRPSVRPTASTLLALLGVVSVGITEPVGLSGAGAIVGAIELALAWLIIERQPTERTAPASSRSPSDRVLIVVLLAAAVGAYALGHDTGPVNAMPGAAGTAFVGVAFLVASSARRSRPAALALSLLVLGSTVVGIAQARIAPYRSASIDQQTVAIEVGRHASQLRLDPPLAAYLTDLRDAADAAGWEPGQRVYGLHVTWSSTLPFFLGAEVPSSIMSLPGGPRGLERLRFDLARQDLEGWSEAWLLLPDFTLTPDDGIEPRELDAVRHAIALFTHEVGTAWPADYDLVWTAPRGAPVAPHSRVTLWRPSLAADQR